MEYFFAKDQPVIVSKMIFILTENLAIQFKNF